MVHTCSRPRDRSSVHVFTPGAVPIDVAPPAVTSAHKAAPLRQGLQLCAILPLPRLIDESKGGHETDEGLVRERPALKASFD